MTFWRFHAEPVRVVDGDTVDLKMDMGFHVHRLVRVRLKGLDTAEIHNTAHDSEEYKRGIEHKEFVVDWLDERNEGAWPLDVRTEKVTGKFGRYIATVEGPDGDVLNMDIIDEFPEVSDDA